MRCGLPPGDEVLGRPLHVLAHPWHNAAGVTPGDFPKTSFARNRGPPARQKKNGPDGRRAPLAKSVSVHLVSFNSVQLGFPHLQFSLFPFSAFRARTAVFSPVTPSRPRPAENFFNFPPAGAYPPRGKQPPCDVGSPPGTKSWEDLCMSLHIPGTTPRA